MDLVRSDAVVTIQNGRLSATEKSSARRLEGAAGLVVSGDCNQVLVPLASATAEAQISIFIAACPQADRPINDHCASEPVLAAFLLSHTPMLSPSPHHLVTTLGLSLKEASAASMLVSGADLSEIALSLGVSREGVRYHLKRLFWKTRTHSQQELVRTITHLITPLNFWTDHKAGLDSGSVNGDD
jgi:DNA-binding CsgD family transcriptional regulator